MRFVLAAIVTALAAWLLWVAGSTHLARACVVMDTPYLPLCPPAASDEERLTELRARLARNPGDSGAWVELTNLETGTHEPALLRAASTLAPNDPNVLKWRAGQALANNELVTATALLVQLIRFHPGTEAPKTLAQLVASGEGTDLLRPHLDTAARWLPQVLASLAAQKLPSGAALPLLSEAASRGNVPVQTVRAFTRSLKAERRWADAYGLWLTQNRPPIPLLFNGGFDQRFIPDGFDWEVTPTAAGKAGAIAAQRGAGKRGQVLEVKYTGRAVAMPVIRQYLMVPPGTYVLRGQFMGSRLRTENGLAWAVRCTTAGAATAPAGKSGPLKDTANAWRSFEFSFTIPADCGLAASLQLETFAPVDAAAGIRGEVSFDAFELRAESL